MWYAASPSARKLEAYVPGPLLTAEADQPAYEGEYVVVNLGDMKVTLRNGTTTLQTMDIISVGKPGSYYETIGGAHRNDYSIRKHFSSIGHVYMPWSVHVYGNFFIHGIPYYPDGTKVSSEYSGGCVRLSDQDAETLYGFVKRGTPIVITGGNEREFLPTKRKMPDMESLTMTRLMVATVSLEVLPQDADIADTDGASMTTRRKLLPRLFADESEKVIDRIISALGEETYVDYMNQKAEALGLSNTTFSSVYEPALTTEEDMERFARYIFEYKSYLLSAASSTLSLSR
jgi:hypothetical protein